MKSQIIVVLQITIKDFDPLIIQLLQYCERQHFKITLNSHENLSHSTLQLSSERQTYGRNSRRICLQTQKDFKSCGNCIL